MSVDSLNRPPTLLTMASSFNSSSMVTPFELPPHNGMRFRGRRVEVFIDHLIVVVLGPGQLSRRRGQAALNRLFRLRPPVPQAGLVRLNRTGPQKNRHTLRILPADLRRPPHLHVEDHAHAPGPVPVHLTPARPPHAAA